MATYTSQYPPAHNSTYVKALSEAGMSAYYATDPTKSLIGTFMLSSWASVRSFIANLRFHIDLGSAKIIKRIYYENNHNSGANTDIGAKTFTVWGSNTASAFAELTYGTDTDWTQITASQATFDQHIAADQADAKYITLTNAVAYRYYAIKIADNWGDTDWIGLRRIVLQTEDAIPAVVPTVTTSTSAASITGVSASVTGAITATGGENASARGICYNTTGTPTTADTCVGDTGYQAYGVGSFTKSLTGLLPNTAYHCRAYATNSAGTGYGAEVDFTTDDVPTVTTTVISAIAGTTATGGGNVTDEGGDAVTARGVCWNTGGNPTTADSKTTDGAGAGVFVSSLTSLLPNVLYYVRAYATNSVGTAYGAAVTFTTIAPPTVTTTSPATSITKGSALISGNLVALGGVDVTTRGVCWNTTGAPTTADSKSADTPGPYAVGPFGKYATGLTQSTLYYARAYAINSEGTSYGAVISFTTLSVGEVASPQVTLYDTYYLPRAGRYANPLNTNDRLPIVYGDLTDDVNGNWKLPCIDTLAYVYCFAAHEVLSVANGNTITIYEDGMELNAALYTFDESNDYEGDGVIATITFASPKDNATITATGKGKPTATGGATLMTNIIDIINDFLIIENNFTSDLFEASYKSRASQVFTAQSYAAAGVIHEDIPIWDCLQNMMASFLGSVYLDGAHELVLDIDDGAIPAEAFAGIIRAADAEFISATQRHDNLINQCPASYGYDYAEDNEFKYHTDEAAQADAVSQAIYGVRKPTLPYKFYWCRQLASVNKVQAIIVGKYAYPVWEIEVTDNTLKRIDADVGRFFAYSAERLYDSDGVQLFNHMWRVLSYMPDISSSKMTFRALQTAYYMTIAYLADGTYLADGSILAGNNRDTTEY